MSEYINDKAKLLGDIFEVKALVQFLNDPDRLLMDDVQQEQHMNYIHEQAVKLGNKLVEMEAKAQ